MKEFIIKTAWPMVPPRPYSAFHICIMAAGFLAAVLAAYFLSRKTERKFFIRLLFFCGVILAASEIYKQLFLYYVVNQEQYDWWYFPFQLCSLPMYFCLLLPLVKNRRLQLIILTFMQDFNLLGGIMALAEPSGLLHPYWFLTLHGLLWHILLIFIGLLIGFSHESDSSFTGYGSTLPLFLICCGIATLINVTAKPLGQADMFYISPYYPNNQAVFYTISQKLGVLPGNIIYLLSICAGGLLFHMIFARLFRHATRS